ncbi:unnamed protein product [Adineta steineri]|uniref:Uncharacterized protein n=1 Tax=Adineta steineri TaxID=433720 RepID=A0A818KX88_9BILA|nr:unnamed protein product [Adineta steineri]CAF3564719.1 unnamed protein product [Adineta steineri]
MAKISSTGKQLIISLRDQSHHVCVDATQETYWQKLITNSSISIEANGKYVPLELNRICSEEDEPRLHLIIHAQCEADMQLLDKIKNRIESDLRTFKGHDHATYDWINNEMVTFGSLFNSLPSTIFETERHLLGQRNCNIKKIRNTLGCSIDVDQPMSQRYRFRIRHENEIVRNIAAVQIEALVRQAHDQYLIAFAMSIGRTLVGPMERIETSSSTTLDLSDFPSFTPFQPSNKRKRESDEQEIKTSSQTNDDSDDSADETTYDETREQCRTQVEHLLDGICKRMQDRTPVDDVAKAREDSSQIKSYFRNKSTSNINGNCLELPIELVEHEIDLRTRHRAEHKCTLVFNKQLKMGGGVCDRIKKTAKVLAYKQLITMTRTTPREYLIVKPTKDKLWKAVMRPMNNQ